MYGTARAGLTMPSLYLALGLGGLALLFIATQIHASRAAQFLRDALQTAQSTEEVYINDEWYRVSNGVVAEDGRLITGAAAFMPLQVAYAKTLAKRSPLVALPGTDPQALQRTVAHLVAVQENHRSIQESAGDAALVDSLYPIDFLRAAAALEERRIDFITHGSLNEMRAYEHALGVALRAYSEDLRAYRTAFELAVPPTVRVYKTGGSIITRHGTIEALEQLQRGITSAIRTHHERMRCVYGFVASCHSEDLSLPSVPHREDPGSAPVPDISPRVQALFRSLGRTYADEPLVALTASACDPDITPHFALMVSEDGGLLPALTGDLRFLKSDLGVPFFQEFAAEGIDYVYDSPSSHYKCPLLERDVTSVLWVHAARQLTGLQGPLITEHDAMRALETGLNLPTLSPEERDRVVALVLQANLFSTGYDRVIETIATAEEHNARAVKRGATVDLSPASLFYFRSGFLSLFLASNPSIQPDFVMPYEQYTIAPEESPYVYLSSLPNTPETEAKVLHDLGYYLTMHAK